MSIADVISADVAPTGWDLSELLPDGEEETFKGRLAELEEAVVLFEDTRRELATLEGPRLLELVSEYESILSRMHVLAAYGSLWFASDTQSEAALAFRSHVEQVLTKMQNRVLFFSIWWKNLEEDPARELLAGCGKHPDKAFFLSELRRFRAFTLDESREQLINLKDTDGVGGLLTVYSMLTDRLQFVLEDDDKELTLTRDELMAWVMSPEAQKREAAYREFFRVFSAEATVLGQIYVHRVRDWHNENVGLRDYSSPLEVRNVSNDVPALAVDRLLEVSRANAEVFRRFFRLKAGWLGVEKLRRCDLYAPLAKSDAKVDYSVAVRSVLDTFADFDESFAKSAARVFAEGHIDSEIRPGKRSGAFCATVLPSLTPWVLVNFAGKMRDVATLAHELGHAVHSMLAESHTVLTQHASLPLAETASVFGEMLMTDRLLASQSDPLVRRELLASAVDDIYATVMRQSYFVLFEREAHQAILEGAALDDVHELYLENLHEQFGDSVDLPAEFRHEWVSIPHIYSTPFYCYSYSFGQLLVLSLYRRYRQDPEGFKPGYLRLLAYGGSARPEEMLLEAGVDITDAAFWQAGFDQVSELIDQLEELEKA